jgi:hypothetical protein
MGFIEKGIRRLKVTLGQQEEAGAALSRDNARSLQEGNELFPLKPLGMGSSVDKIECEPSTQERVGSNWGRQGHGKDNRL